MIPARILDKDPNTDASSGPEMFTIRLSPRAVGHYQVVIFPTKSLGHNLRSPLSYLSPIMLFHLARSAV